MAPLKQITIPRLEIQAATLASKMDKMLRRELQLEPSVLWTDSQSLLKYINNDQTRFRTFVANRLPVVRDLTTKDQWKYVSTGNNPADKASRGMHVDALLRSKLWFNGPDFLCTDESQWPQVTKECLPLRSEWPGSQKSYTSKCGNNNG